MRTAVPFVAAVVFFASVPLDEASAEQKRRWRKSDQRSATPIACTQTGCAPIEPGCRIEVGFTQDGMLSGYDTVVCPLRPSAPNG